MKGFEILFVGIIALWHGLVLISLMVDAIINLKERFSHPEYEWEFNGFTEFFGSMLLYAWVIFLLLIFAALTGSWILSL